MNGLTKLDNQMLTQLSRALIGFDRMFDNMEFRTLSSGYPPYNIVRTGENTYAVELAVAGFKKSEIMVEVEHNQLTVKGQSETSESTVEKEYLHKGLANRDFVKTFPLAEHIIVKDAVIENGVLTINLEREIPDSLKPRVIDIVEVK